jgi:hypothetical protein
MTSDWPTLVEHVLHEFVAALTLFASIAVPLFW